ncbi:MAG TPA: hypothetical protein VFS53_03085 [Gemmatimonadota bacterium]|nr:hypothetical protein [Gemmatimonadota bacterium]
MRVSRLARNLLWTLLAVAVLVAIWVAGGFLWPRPQFDRPGAPWGGDSIRSTP